MFIIIGIYRNDEESKCDNDEIVSTELSNSEDDEIVNVQQEEDEEEFRKTDDESGSIRFPIIYNNNSLQSSEIRNKRSASLREDNDEDVCITNGVLLVYGVESTGMYRYNSKTTRSIVAQFQCMESIV